MRLSAPRFLIAVAALASVLVLSSGTALAQTTATPGTTTPGTTTPGTTTPGTTTPGTTTPSSTGIISQLGAIVRCNASINPADNLGSFVTYTICVLSRYATAIAVLIVMAAGLMYVFSGSNPSLAGTAKAMIITTLTGLIAMYSISLVLSILISSGFITTGT